MKKEVEAIVRIISGFIQVKMAKSYICQEYLYGTSCKWKITKKADREIIKVDCWLNMAGVWTQAYTSYPEIKAFPSETAQYVHDNLVVFVEGVIKNFPDLEEQWQFLLRAAKPD